MRVGYVQFAPEFGEKERNLRRIEELLAGEEADLWVLPELCTTGYQFRNREELEELAEPVPQGPTVRRLLALARQRGCHLVVGIAEAAGDRFYNSALLLGPQGVLAHYRKIHLFYEEKNLFAPGDRPLAVAEVGAARVGLLICYDHLFPEVARTLALLGADLLAHPANLVIPGLGQLTMRVRALENRVFTVTANRIGTEARTGEALRFTGLSQVVAPDGQVLAQAPQDQEEVRAVEIDLHQARNKRLTRLNDVLADRRPEFYRILGGK
ncbi:MAG: nitrilase-related carbon-nitrogen hydrolase [Candidatus Bipolaricaulaceae bacterium]